jgi:hypothetical protein
MIKSTITATALLLTGGTAAAATWKVEITNVTPGQTFAPIIAATHYGSIDMFEPGMPASDDLAMLAEGGNIAPLGAALAAAGHRVSDIETNDMPLPPSESVTLTLKGRPGQRLSLAGMLVPTNDTFVGVDSVFLPVSGELVVAALAYDAGTEANDQNCAHIPGGGTCAGEGYSMMAMPADEGFVHVSNGIHDLGSSDGMGNDIVQPAHYDWNNPVAIVKITRVYGKD